MSADAGDGSTVPVKLHTCSWLGAMTLPLVGGTLFTPHDKLVDIVGGEGETGHSNGAGLLVLKVKALLRRVCVYVCVCVCGGGGGGIFLSVHEMSGKCGGTSSSVHVPVAGRACRCSRNKFYHL